MTDLVDAPSGADDAPDITAPAPAAVPARFDTRIRFTTIHGYDRAYRMCGSGPALLLLHGIGDSSESWEPLMAALAERYTVVAPDLLGHGASDKPRADYSVAAYANGMRDLLDVLDIDRATIVGHSLGGGVAAQICYQYPRRCERLVLVASGGVSRQVTPILRLASAPFAEVTLPMIKWPGSRLAGLAFLQLNRLLDTDLGCDRDELVRVFDGLPDGAARFSFTRTLRSVVDWRGQVMTMLDRCYLADGLPTLLVWGDRDAIIPVDHGRMAHAAMPSSRLEIFEGAGHFPHHKDPERFRSVLDEFIATTVPLEYDADRWKGRLRDGAPGGVRR